jgi:nicotinamidase-related amidase
MSSIVDIRAYVNPSAIPILTLVDLQQEYLASPRALAIPSASDALVNCRAALAHARKLGWPVAFIRWTSCSPFFNRATKFSRWIEGFEPTGADMVFERDQPSCYASSQFNEVITSSGGNYVLAGFAGEAACLSTAVDAFHRGHHITYLSDASASHALDDADGHQVHQIVTKIMGLYGDVMPTTSWISATSRSRAAHEKPHLVSRGEVQHK